ncbi:leucyl aminopeptidase, partial [Acinetobacter baumannii]
IATLTGNVGEALGLKLAGIWGDQRMTQELVSAGENCGDFLWPMPLVDDYEELLKSDYADMTTISPIPYGGAIVAALFLRRFVADSMRWVHID